MTARHPPLITTNPGKSIGEGNAKIREHFLGWQCRVRQYSLRKEEGRPTAGMRPALSIGEESVGPITVLIVKQYSEEYTAQFRYMVQKTNDPAERYHSALQMLSSAYYQRAKEFSDQMTALFGSDSPSAARLLNEGHAQLDFSEYNQSYRLRCTVKRLAPESDGYQATFWHNHLFNSNLPGDVVIVGFQPDWSTAEATPPP